ncbi:MAG TPA: glycosyltransferase family 39 protein, partial [bacterium]|nr:glycosyltransferase family 39 protein [bacterium]
NKKHVILLLILLAGFILRLVYLYYLKDTVFFAPLLMDKHDQKTFMIWAQQILKNPWLVDGKAFYMAPLYPYFLAVLHFFSAWNLVLIVTLQLVLDIVLCGLIFFLGKKIYNAWVGLLAAFFACFYKTSIVYASSILSDSLIFFLYILFIVLVYNALEKPNFCRWLIAGIVLGLAALSKPTIAIYLPFLFIGLYLYPDKKLLPLNISKKFHPVLALLLLLIVSGLTILPVTLRNYYVSGKLIPICTNGLVNWQIGNSSDSIGLFYYPKGELLSPFSIAFWKLFVTKLNIFFTSYEWPQNLNVYMMETIIPFLKTAFVRFGLIIPMGMGGLLVLMLNWKKNFIFISFAITNVLWVVLFFIVDRYRLPAVGCFMVSAAFLMVWSIEKIRQKKFFAPLAVWVPVAAFAYFFNIIPGQLIPSVSIETFAGLSVRNIENAILTGDLEGGYRKAETYYRLMPGDFRSNFMLACVLSDMGKKQAAIYYLEQTLKINPGFEPAQRFIKDLKNS